MKPDRLIPMAFFESLAEARKSLRENSLLALETQNDIITWLKKDESQDALYHFLRVYGLTRLNEQDRMFRSSLLRSQMQDILSTATTYYVSPDMSEMAKMAAEEMLTEGLSPAVIPSERGFLMFARPIVMYGPGEMLEEAQAGVEAPPEVTSISAIAWSCNEAISMPGSGLGSPKVTLVAEGADYTQGVTYYLYTTPHDMAVSINQVEQRHQDEGRADANGFFYDEAEVRERQGPMPLYDFSGWAYGNPWTVGDDKAEWGGRDDEGRMKVYRLVDQARRLMLATWMLLGQKLTAIDSERPPRAMVRRAQQNIPDPGDIVVVRLRKEAAQKLTEPAVRGEDYEGPWWSHRHLVRGHWKRQAYGPGLTERKLIWVEPYIRGPEGTPLIMKDRIYSLEA